MTRILAVFAAVFLAFSAFSASPAAAQTSAIEQAKAAGQVGEQADGYLGFVAGQVPQDLVAAVNEINIRRRAEYTRLAEEQGTSVEVVARLTAERLIDRVPAGQWYRNAGGQWVQK